MMQGLTRAAMTVIGGTLLIATGLAAQAPVNPQQVPQAPAAKAAQQAPADRNDDETFTFDGDTALWAVAVNPGKTEAFDQIMGRLRQALENSSDPQRRRQAAGWKVVRLNTPMPDGTIGYVHMIHPVVPGADYSIMRILYDAFPDERQALYDLYRGAFAKNLSLATGTMTADLSRASAVSPEPPASAVPGPPASPAPAPTTPQTVSPPQK
jgi:hypothetical protein